jgi:hypothetical protein
MELRTPRLQRIDPVMCAAVFGTPGIGKSIFEFYFFNRYIAEHPDHIIQLSYWVDFEVKEICIYNLNQSRNLKFVEKIFRGVDLHLCDGAPSLIVKESMVCFTSPNFKFFDKIIGKNTLAKKFVMPNWTEDELLEANLALNLGISESEIKSRFETYGPVARIVLQNLHEKFEDQKSRVEAGLNKIHSWKQVAPYFDVSLEKYQGFEDIAHCLFKIEPVDNPRKYRIEFASNYLAEQIRKRLEDISELDRKQ